MKELKQLPEKELRKRMAKSKEVTRVARRYLLTESLIEEGAELAHEQDTRWGRTSWWNEVSRFQPLSEDFIEKHKGIVNWIYIMCKQKISEEFALKNSHYDRWFWHHISENQHIGSDFYEKHLKKVEWRSISLNPSISDDFIEKHSKNIDWYNISKFRSLSEDFIIRNQEKLDFKWVIRNPSVAKDFFERNKHLITKKLYASELAKIVQYQTLSEETLEQMKKGKMVWDSLSIAGAMSRDFVINNYNNLNKNYIRWWNKNIDSEIKAEVNLIEKLSGK
jgi:hypothetical protein